MERFPDGSFERYGYMAIAPATYSPYQGIQLHMHRNTLLRRNSYLNTKAVYTVTTSMLRPYFASRFEEARLTDRSFNLALGVLQPVHRDLIRREQCAASGGEEDRRGTRSKNVSVDESNDRNTKVSHQARIPQLLNWWRTKTIYLRRIPLQIWIYLILGAVAYLCSRAIIKAYHSKLS